jgi:hypothetical protein
MEKQPFTLVVYDWDTQKPVMGVHWALPEASLQDKPLLRELCVRLAKEAQELCESKNLRVEVFKGHLTPQQVRQVPIDFKSQPNDGWYIEPGAAGEQN